MGKNKERMDAINRFEKMIEKQTGLAVRPYRTDGYVNMMNRYGTKKDTSEQYQYELEPYVGDDTLTKYYESNGLFSKIIDAPAEEAIKHGFKIKNLNNVEIEEFYESALDELDWEETAITALKWSRLFGGAIAVMLINDGRGLEEPVDWKNIKSIDDIRVFDRSVIIPDYQSLYNYRNDDPFRTRGSRLGLPETYTINSMTGNFVVHDSRCLVFQNGVLPEKCSNSIYQIWGMPEYVRINKAIRDAEVAHGSAVKLLDRSIQAVYKMRNLAAELATEEGEDRVLKRLQTIDMARGLLNSITIDAEGEDYDFRTFQFSGISDVIDTTCNYLSAITNIPQTILFGRSPAGMNSTGTSDLENYYNYVERIQKRMVKKNLRYLLSVIFQAGISTGEIEEIPSINIEFETLWSMSESEKIALEQQKASIQQTKAATAQIYVGMQAIDPSEVRKKLAESDEFDVENILDDYDEEDLFTELNENEEVDNSSSAPEAAPTATKLPQDMSAEEVSDMKNQDSADDINEGVGVIVVKDGKILTGTRTSDFGRGLLCGPGGHLKSGESPKQAAFRETEEEFGISPKELIEIGRGEKEPDTGISPTIFLCTEYSGTPKTVDGEMNNIEFRTLAEIKDMDNMLFMPFKEGVELFKSIITEIETRTDGGPGSGNFGHEGVTGQLGGSAPSESGGSKGKVRSELAPQRDDYEDRGNGFESFMQDNVKKLMPVFEEGGMEAVQSEYYKHRLSSSTTDLKEIDRYEVEDILGENMTRSYVDGWMKEADSGYKPKLVHELTASPEVRNAALNVMYENYKTFNPDSTSSFEDFINTPVTMYRGGHGQQHTEDDIFSSYSFDRKIAEKFAGNGGNIYEAQIRPIDTYGSLSTDGESEIFVPSEIAPNGNIDEKESINDKVYSSEKNIENTDSYAIVTSQNSYINKPENNSEVGNDSVEEGICKNTDGGPGSGNFGHEGVPGQLGGSKSKGKTIPNAYGRNKKCTGFRDKTSENIHMKHLKEFPELTLEQYVNQGIEFLRQPCGGNIDGYLTENGEICRFDITTGEYAKGIPGAEMITYFKAKFKNGKANLNKANEYFNALKKEEMKDE